MFWIRNSELTCFVGGLECENAHAHDYDHPGSVKSCEKLARVWMLVCALPAPSQAGKASKKAVVIRFAPFVVVSAQLKHRSQIIQWASRTNMHFVLMV